MGQSFNTAKQIISKLTLRPDIDPEVCTALLATFLKDQERSKAEHQKELRPKEIKAALAELESALKSARKLLEAASDDFDLALAKTLQRKLNPGASLYPSEGMKFIRALEDALGDLEAASRVAANEIKPHGGRPHDTVKANNVTILAEIFAYLTGKKPTRRVHGGNAKIELLGKNYGPFWNFCEAVWISLYNNTDGLSTKLQKWEKYKTKGQVWSEWVTVQLNLHPEWGKSPTASGGVNNITANAKDLLTRK